MTSITVTLIAPAVINGVLTRYDVKYADNDQFTDPSVKPIEPPEESKIIQNLTPDTMYYFKVKGSNYYFIALLAKGQRSLCDGLSSVCTFAIYEIIFF